MDHSGMENAHSIKGKTTCIQLLMLVTGLESLLFNVLAQLDVFPCTPPLNFFSRRQGKLSFFSDG